MTNHYELLYLVPATYTEDELVSIKEKVKDLLKKFSGEVTAEDSFGKKKLAYPIKGNHQGYYLLYEFNLEGAKLKELDQNLKLTNEVLRHIIVRRELKSAESRKKSSERLKAAEEKRTIEEKPEVIDEKKAEKDKGKIKLKDLDQRLDEILEGDIL
ncbi:MAG: 30S ribosomal protein S6 [Patescibacteria group bacterium]